MTDTVEAGEQGVSIGPNTTLPPSPITLSDGTRLESLIDRERRRVRARVFNDPEIYDIEQREIWGRSWIAVGHESEIPDPGDFVSRYIGEDPVIVTRDRSGGIQILLNVCSHRAMGVCRAELGTTRYFTCPYHGWKYDLEGKLVAVPAEKKMYEDRLDREEYGLPRARVGLCGGIIFGNWDADAPSLDEYLGPAARYLRLSYERTESGLVVAGPPERWTIDSNWKFAADQFQGDAYHTAMLHHSMVDAGYIRDPEAILEGVNIGTKGGHHIRLLDFRAATVAGATKDEEPLEKLSGLTPELARAARDYLSPEDADLLSTHPPSTGNVFPNVFWFTTRVPPLDSTPSPGILSVRVLIPRGPDRVEQMAWAMVEKDAPEEVQEASIRNLVQTFGPGGGWDQDDSEAWVAVQRAIKGAQGRRRWLTYEATQGGHTDELPGMTFRGVARDDCQWLAWERYFDVMTGGDDDRG